jgi:hypothetical protein
MPNDTQAVGHAAEPGAQRVRHAFAGTSPHKASGRGETDIPAPPNNVRKKKS